jgi:single-strand DNA-binding protein
MKKLIVIGNVGREPQTRTTKNGKEFAEFSIAVNNADKSTTWISVVVNKSSKVTDYITKGKQLYIEGNFSVDVYKGEPSITLFANDVQLLGNADKSQEIADVVDRNPDTF